MIGNRKLKTYKPSIDPELAEDGVTLGINLISNVVSPAVKIRGVAFSSHKIKNLEFRDDIKMRIAAPVLVPSYIYRDDEDEQYYIKFTEEDVEIIAKDFMSRLTSKGEGVFNLEHKDEMVDSFILEAILVDSDEKVKMISTQYGIDLPLGSFFIVQQFNNRKVYDDIVKRGATSFSFEGFLGTELIKEYKFKNEESMKNLKLSKMKKPRKIVGTKRVLMSASKKVKFEDVIEGEELILISEDFKEGSDLVVIEDVTEGAKEDFTGEIDITNDGVEEILIVEDGTITEVVEVSTDEDEDKEEAEIVEEVKVEEEEMENEEEEEEAEEIKAENTLDIGSELAEIYTILAEIKAELSEIKSDTNAIEEVEEDESFLREQKFANALSAFNTKFRKR